MAFHTTLYASYHNNNKTVMMRELRIWKLLLEDELKISEFPVSNRGMWLN